MACLDLRFYIGVEITGVVRGVQASEDCKTCWKNGERRRSNEKGVAKKGKT